MNLVRMDDDNHDNPADDLIRNIIARYESEEDEFLREFEEMHRQTSEGTSPCKETPMFGALCSLVGEISKLRRENKALRCRLNVAVEPKRSVVHRVSAILEGRSNLIPKFIGRRAFHHGARERLSTPPHKEILTTSSYSTDISSDISDPLRTTLTPTRQIPAPPIVLPEMSDSDAEHSIFTEVALPDYENVNSETSGAHASVRCSKVLPMSERTSLSSASSYDRSENLTSSRSGFFEIIGLKKKKEKSIESKKETITCKVVLKKRKRKISESSSIHSTENNTRSDKWSLSSMTSKNSSAIDKNACDDTTNGSKQSFLQAPKQYRIQRQHTGQSAKKCPQSKHSTTLSEESDDDHSKNALKNSHAFHGEIETIRNELVMTRNRNNRLIEQLREKSMEQSKLRTQMNTLQKQIGILRNRCRLNEALEKLSINDRLMTRATATIDNVETKLKVFDEKVQAVKAEMMKNSQVVINQSFREQNAYQSCLEHIERLQRNNLSMLQDRGSDIGSHDQRIRQLLEMMPSYDALYSFTISLVQKLGQLRASYIEKNICANRSDFEALHAQSSLLVIQAQLERLKLQLYEVTKRQQKRPVSYHGEDLLQKIIKPQMNFLLPFKLYGARIRKHHRSDSCAMEAGIEKNEQSIENEFLRLFDYARCLSRISEFTEAKKAQVEGAGISNSGLHTLENSKSTIIIPRQGVPIRHRELPVRNSANKIYVSPRNCKIQPAGRPMSMVETEGRTLVAGNNPHFDDCIVKKIENNMRKSSPILDMHPSINHVPTRSVVSSMQDVRNNTIRSPPLTPLITRRMHSNERPRTIDQELFDSSGNEMVKYDTAVCHSSVDGSSDYAVINPKQFLAEKRSMISKRSPVFNPSRLPHLRKNLNPANSPALLGDSDGRGAHQLRRNPETVAMTRENRERNTGSTVPKSAEKSRLPKISSILTEKKKCTSWLSRIKANK